MIRILLIGAGGFLGSVARHLTSGAVQGLSRSVIFPWGTFAVNVIGCFVIGVFSQLSESRGLLADTSRAFVVIGFLGGFTTFSAFGNETLNLMREGETVLGLANATGQVVLCLSMVWLGRAAAYGIWR